MFETLPQTTIEKIARRQRLQAKGQMLAAYVAALNEAKELTQTQVGEFMGLYSGIFMLLMSGSLETAQTAIAALTPDGTLVTTDDKAAILSELGAAIQAES
jgi:hypothetical protein